MANNNGRISWIKKGDQPWEESNPPLENKRDLGFETKREIHNCIFKLKNMEMMLFVHKV